MAPRGVPPVGTGSNDPIPPTVAWRGGKIRLIDQRALPGRLRYLSCATVGELIDAVQDLAVRGAPALGVVGAYGVALAARTSSSAADVRAASLHLVGARPTAVNLAWGVEQALAAYAIDGPRGALVCAHALAADDVEGNRRLGGFGAALLPDGARVLTHCNAGSLACVGYGTALGVIRAHHEQGRGGLVWVDETRPVLQGARLTAWELDRLGIPYQLIVDSAAGSLFASDKIDAVVVGADRIAANGDVANKVGTYSLAVLARAHRIPFYVAAPVSTLDVATRTGSEIPIETRATREVTHIEGTRVVPAAAVAHNPAFDITPARLVTALITNHGVIPTPTRTRLRTFLASSGGVPARNPRRDISARRTKPYEP